MKKKLIAAVTSLVMVATLAPATAFAGTNDAAEPSVPSVESSATTQTRGEADLSEAAKDFQKAVSQLPDISDQEKVDVDSAKTAYVTANEMYKGLSKQEKARVTDSYNTLEAFRKQVVAIYVTQLEKAIDSATADLIKPGEDFAKVTTIIDNLKDLDEYAYKTATNYEKYTEALAAEKVATAIENSKAGLTSDEYPAIYAAVGVVEGKTAFANSSEEVRSKANNYSLYKEAKARVDAVDEGVALINKYAERFDKVTEALNASVADGKYTPETTAKIEDQIAAADKLLDEAMNDDALWKAFFNRDLGLVDEQGGGNAIAAYWAASGAMLDARDAAAEDVNTTKAAKELKDKVAAIKTDVTLDDMAAIQEIYDLAQAENDKVDTYTREQADKLATDLLAVVEKNKNKAALTEAILKAFPVPASAEAVTLEDRDAILAAYDVVVNETLVGESITDKVDKTSDAYISGRATIVEAYKAYIAKKEKAEAAADKYIAAVEALNPDFNWYDSAKLKEFALQVSDAQALYDALPKAYQKDGIEFDTYADAKDNSLAGAYRTLSWYQQALGGEPTAADKALLVELVEGTHKLADASKLTIADKDTVYALRDKREALSRWGKIKFATDEEYGYLDAKLTAAIKKIDQLVVADLIKEIDKLTIVKAGASLEDIQKAKAANAAAREAYDALTATQKKEVTNSTVLEKAEKAVADAEVQYIKAQLVAISKLDTKALTLDQAKQIKAIEAMIADLDAEHKAQVEADLYYKGLKPAVEAAEAVIKAANALENAKITAIPDQTYTGKAIEPAVEVKDAAGNVIDPKAYTVSYENNVNAGTAKVIVSSSTPEDPTGHQTATFTIKPADASGAVVTVGNKTYTGKALEPITKVVVNGKTLAEGTDYTVAYKNNVKVGKATVTITGQGNYTGTAAKAFVVKPGKANVTSLKAGKKKATVKIKAIPGATTYKIAYKQRGTSYKYKYTTTSATAKTITGLKSGKVYKVKVLAYTKVNGKSYYTGYSTIKTVKVK